MRTDYTPALEKSLLDQVYAVCNDDQKWLIDHALEMLKITGNQTALAKVVFELAELHGELQHLGYVEEAYILKKLFYLVLQHYDKRYTYDQDGKAV